jgi:hypothetical protein
MRNAYTISVGKPVRMESLGRLRIVGDGNQMCLRKKMFLEHGLDLSGSS